MIPFCSIQSQNCLICFVRTLSYNFLIVVMSNRVLIILSVVLIYIIAINIAAFFMFGSDKRKAENHQWRTPEKTLFLAAILGGSVGALFGMKHFRHKTKHLSFQIGIPAILIVQLMLLACMVYFLWGSWFPQIS